MEGRRNYAESQGLDRRSNMEEVVPKMVHQKRLRCLYQRLAASCVDVVKVPDPPSER